MSRTKEIECCINKIITCPVCGSWLKASHRFVPLHERWIHPAVIPDHSWHGEIIFIRMNTVTVAESRFSPRRSADFITDNRGTAKHVPKIDKHGDKRAAGSFAYLHYGTVTRPLAARAFMDRLILGLTTLSQISAFKSTAPPGFLLALLVHPPCLLAPLQPLSRELYALKCRLRWKLWETWSAASDHPSNTRNFDTTASCEGGGRGGGGGVDRGVRTVIYRFVAMGRIWNPAFRQHYRRR